VEALADVGGIPLGLFDGMGYANSTVHLMPGDAVFLYTDGVSEAQNNSEDDFSDDRVIAALDAGRQLDCRALIGEMTRKVTQFTDGAPQSDDITMLAIRRLRV
jgi:sigma-B regulation protein RsbU (phosphoserine phosphatase)